MGRGRTVLFRGASRNLSDRQSTHGNEQGFDTLAAEMFPTLLAGQDVLSTS